MSTPGKLIIKIDLNKILADKTYKAASGADYLDAVLIPSAESRYGDTHFIVQSLPREDRDAGRRGPIIGNAKPFPNRGGGRLGDGEGEGGKPAPKPASPAPVAAGATEDIPF